MCCLVLVLVVVGGLVVLLVGVTCCLVFVLLFLLLLTGFAGLVASLDDVAVCWLFAVCCWRCCSWLVAVLLR